MSEIIEITPGVALHILPGDKFKTTNVGIYFYRPLDNKQNVTRAALIPLVLRRGCRKYPTARAIASALEEFYGAALGVSVMKRGEVQVLRFGMKALSGQYAMDGDDPVAGTLHLLLDMLFDPVIDQEGFLEENVAIEKEDLKDDIKSIINDKREYAMFRCKELMCEGEHFALSENGDYDEVDKISRDDLYSFYKGFIKIAPVDIFVCGQADRKAIVNLLKSYFKSSERADYPKTLVDSRKRGEIRHFSDEMDVNQGKLCIGFRTHTAASSDDYYALMVANEIFGGGVSSKLFNNVREKLSLAYYASSRLEKLKELMLVSSGVEFANFQKAYDEIMVQFHEVQEGNVTQEELGNAKRALKNALLSLDDSPRQLQDFMVSNLLSAGADVKTYLEKIEAVTLEDIKRVFARIEVDTVYQLTGPAAK